MQPFVGVQRRVMPLSQPRALPRGRTLDVGCLSDELVPNQQGFQRPTNIGSSLIAELNWPPTPTALYPRRGYGGDPTA